MLKEICVIHTASQNYGMGNGKLSLSARAYDRILKVSRTIADLAPCIEIKQAYLAGPFKKALTVKAG